MGIKVNAGVVSLNGTAKSWKTSAEASWKAWLVDGVKFVKNDVTVAE
jgi:osmotically-inducible protein OsmY